MSRSIYKYPRYRIYIITSDRFWKTTYNRRNRRRTKSLLIPHSILEDVHLDSRVYAYSNRWYSGKEITGWDNKAFTYTRRKNSK